MSNKTDLILVGGFLGAGKTSLLWEVAKRLNLKGRKVGLITNDQASELVDTSFLETNNDIVEEVRKYSDVPLVFLTYINPVFYYGYEEFFARCEELGVDGIIVPDLPYDEKDEILDFASSHDVDIISMIAPTSKERIQMIASDASGFIYVVSSLGVTGVRSEIKTDIKSIITLIKEVTDVPAAVGFGINTPEQAENISKIADGVIVGSAIVKIIAEHGENAKEPIVKYVKSMKTAVLKGQL